MSQINLKEYNAIQSLNTSRPNSKAHLQNLKNEYLMQYPQQPREQNSSYLLPFESDSREIQCPDSLTKRVLTTNINKISILAESGKQAQKLIKFVQKMKNNNTSFIKNAFVKTLLLDKIFDGQLELYQTLLQVKKVQFKFPFNRYGWFRSVWKVFLQVIYLSIVLFSPLILLHPENKVLESLLLMQLIAIIFNGVLNLHTCYYYNDVEVTNIKAIQLNYIKKKGFSDFFMSISLCLVLLLVEIQSWLITTLILILSVGATQKLKLRFSFYTMFNFGFFQKIFEGVIYCHLFSIIYLAQDETQKYLALFYKCIQNYLLIQSDFEFETNFQIILALIIEALFFINKIGLIMELVYSCNKNLEYYHRKNDYYHLKTYLNNHNINKNLIQLALHNYKFQTGKEMSQSNSIIHQRLLKHLNFNIQQNIDRMVKTQYFKKIALFKKFSSNTQDKIIDLMKFQKIEANETIINYNQNDDQSLYLIKKGQVKLCYNGTKQVPLKILKESNIFGEVSFFSGLRRTCTIVSMGPVQLYKIQRDDFLSAIKSNGEDLEIACNIRDQIQFENKFDELGLKCLCCNSSYHLIHFCKYLTYRPDNERVLSQYLFDHQQDRKIIKRERMRSYNSRYYMFQLNLVGEEFQENNFKDEEILQDFTSNNQNQLSFTGIQQQKRQSLTDKITDLEDSRDQFQEIVQLISKKQYPQKNSPLQEIIQELNSSESSGSSLRNINEQQIQFSNFKQQQQEKLQDQLNINQICQKSAHSLSTPISGYDQISRNSKRSATQMNKEVVLQSKQNHLIQYLGEDLEKNHTDPESIYRKTMKFNKCEDNTHQFYVFSNTNPNQGEFNFQNESFEKSNNFIHYYPQFNPNYLFLLYNSKKNQNTYTKNKYTISYVVSNKIKSKLCLTCSFQQ